MLLNLDSRPSHRKVWGLTCACLAGVAVDTEYNDAGDATAASSEGSCAEAEGTGVHGGGLAAVGTSTSLAATAAGTAAAGAAATGAATVAV
jgi:hypothetical protein